MATQLHDNVIPGSNIRVGTHSRPRMRDLAIAIVEPLASLKLTVILLTLGVFVTWVVSMQQTQADIGTIKAEHMRSPIVTVPFSIFFPRALFGERFQDVRGTLFLPSGATVLFAMLVNLVAAHCIRMRIQAKGKRLLLGLVVGLIAAGITTLVIFGGQNANGFQGVQDPAFFRKLWYSMKAAIGLVGVASAIAAFRADRLFLRIGFAGLGIGCLGLLFALVTWGESAFIGDSAMRILWQLIQATMAAAVGLVACNLIFKRKGAMVLIHVGIMMLMLNEIYVSYTNEEQRMRIPEGETVQHTIDIRATEFFVAAIDESDNATVTTIDSPMLLNTDVIQHDDLPFNIRCESFYTNASLSNRTSPLADSKYKGWYRFIDVTPQTAAVGTGAGAVDEPAALVELIDKKDGKSLGFFASAIRAYDSSIVDTVSVDGQTFYLGMRFKHAYKDYSIHLVDFENEVYPGTEIARSFKSDILLNDPRHNVVNEPQKVWMNNPLRYGDETIYQSSHGVANGSQFTEFQIVKNKGWMIPYVACMFVMLGLVGQFSGKFSEFLTKLASINVTGKPSVVAMLVVGAMVMWAVSYAMRNSKPIELAQLRIDKLGQIPILNEGRVQPLESLARNTARQLQQLETVTKEDKVKYPALRWFADTVFMSPGWEDYRIIRITDQKVLNQLNLEPRSGFRYSMAEVDKSSEQLKTAVSQIRNDSDSMDKLTNEQKRILQLDNSISMIRNLQMAFGDPKLMAERDPNIGDDPLGRLIVGAKMAEANELPLVAPAKSTDMSHWVTLSTAFNQDWLRKTAEQFGLKSDKQLAEYFIGEYYMKPVMNKRIQEDMVMALLADPEVIKILNEISDDTENAQAARMEALSTKITAEKRQEIQDKVRKSVEADLESEREQLVARALAMVQQIGSINSDTPSELAESQSLLLRLPAAYLDRDHEQFNETLDDYLASSPIATQRPTQRKYEHFYNQFAPLFVSQVFYLIGFLLAMASFIIFPRVLSQSALGIIGVGLLIHLMAIYMRIVISGRPPITTLYSSFVFVGAGVVLGLLIIEMLTRRRIGTAFAGLAGWGLVLASWYLISDSGDTFTVLVAVLDTQFWLTTHVICIAIGYVMTILAGLVGVIAIALRFTNISRDDLRVITNIVYGVTCFALVFSFFGTVLGGLWADDSWGRFWGWDTKETGALMIVFWNAVLLHARWAGLIRERGIAVIATLGIAVTTWSWQGVNLLQVGLHNYGFSETGFILMIGAFGLCVGISLLALIPVKGNGGPQLATKG
ncbi:MAG: cytochrome c biogenesis protein CcsA [Pirellulaceae bacterium]